VAFQPGQGSRALGLVTVIVDGRARMATKAGAQLMATTGDGPVAGGLRGR